MTKLKLVSLALTALIPLSSAYADALKKMSMVGRAADAPALTLDLGQCVGEPGRADLIHGTAR